MSPPSSPPSSPVAVPVVRLPHGRDLPLPAQATRESAGVDLLAAVGETVVLAPGARALVPCGIALALPEGHEGQVRPRSGLAVRHGVTVLNSPGTIDADYRGEVSVILINHGAAAFMIERGMRIAQLIVAPVRRVTLSPVEHLPGTARGEGGFGSTG